MATEMENDLYLSVMQRTSASEWNMYQDTQRSFAFGRPAVWNSWQH